MSPPVGEVARSARGVDRQNASPLQVKGSALVAARRNLRTKCGNSVRSTATLRAGAQLNVKSAKGVWVGETNGVCLRNVRVFPHSNTLSLLSLSSETVRWTVSEEHYTSKLPLFCGTYFPDGENQHYREPDYHALAHKPVCEAYPERGIRQEALHEV